MTILPCFTLNPNATPLCLIFPEHYDDFLSQQPATVRTWLQTNGFKAQPGQYCLVPDALGQLAMVCVGVAQPSHIMALSDLPQQLPPGTYAIADSSRFDRDSLYLWSLGWGLGAYQFTRYKAAKKPVAQLQLAQGINHSRLHDELSASYWVRDLINTPAEDMMPEQVAEEAERLTQSFKGSCAQIVGDALINTYPMVHAVGRASSHPPRLIDLRFGDRHLPNVTLVGKGVCFDSGGLDLKNASGMQFMKKDMGGAAHVLGLAHLLLAQQLPIHLRVLIPTVENAIGANAFRPGDILATRQGLTVEIGNTDAEGRLILADALSAAVEEQPDLLIDFATLTGAARIAVGTDIAAYFCNEERVAQSLQTASNDQQDPCWRLPLFKGYQNMLKSAMADINNATSSGYAGAITAALFLQAFVPDSTPWLHFDVMAFNVKTSPGKPEGGEAMGLRAAFHLIEQWLQA